MRKTIIEIQDHIIKKLKEENQQLRDEVARLNGEKGKPKIRPNVPDIPRDNSNHQVGKSKTWKKKAKRTRVKIDRVQKFLVDRSILPDDVIPKGFRSVVIQDIVFKTFNTECLAACHSFCKFVTALYPAYFTPLPSLNTFHQLSNPR
jgi:hypothetical protein